MTTLISRLKQSFYAAVLAACCKATAFYFLLRVMLIGGDTVWTNIRISVGVLVLLLLRSTQIGVYYGKGCACLLFGFICFKGVYYSESPYSCVWYVIDNIVG